MDCRIQISVVGYQSSGGCVLTIAFDQGGTNVKVRHVRLREESHLRLSFVCVGVSAVMAWENQEYRPQSACVRRLVNLFPTDTCSHFHTAKGPVMHYFWVCCHPFVAKMIGLASKYLLSMYSLSIASLLR